MDHTDVSRFAATFQAFLDQVVEAARSAPDGAVPVAERIHTFLGQDPVTLPVITEPFPTFQLATVQVALDRLLQRPGVQHELLGIAGDGREHESLTEILETSRRHGRFWIGSVDYTSVPVAIDDDMTCVRFGLYLIDDGTRRLTVLLRGGDPLHGSPAMLEILTGSMPDAKAWLAELRAERATSDVLRGQVLSFEPSEFEPGAGPVRFHRRPQLDRDDVVLPEGVLERVERQVIGIARHRDRLRREGRHLKRGVLLYGPPGTGKTHTVRYLTGVLPDFTVVLLAGPAIRFVSEACALARNLQPALIVLEDCDLVAEDRSFTPEGNPLLFTVLDEMEGLADDADVCFLLTTNRADLIDTALAQRPGRVDLAVEVPLPDPPGRRRLFEIYGRGISVQPAEVDTVVERTEGVPASFIKEMTRRATLLAAERDADDTTAADVLAAIDELTAAQEALTRRLLGSGDDHEPDIDEIDDDPGDIDDEFETPATDRGWFAYAPRSGQRYRGR
ncbi:AAA family ATPase [Phytoactinopolyspora limicola]|uniref:AAA family ATPase n=1 Tax=Phytoactinopolyspora limicola TaxID=2715536 RepID=UPI00140D0390|nr:ATP-binding protein [Phytoactinopolyspora limicola]